jgi:hypothetical protein
VVSLVCHCASTVDEVSELNEQEAEAITFSSTVA